MEKQGFLDAEVQPPRPDKKAQFRSRLKMVTILVLSYVAIWQLNADRGTWFPLRAKDREPSTCGHDFSWANLSKKPHLEYESCYGGGFQCARLELPMDYWNGTTDETIGLAVIKKPAAVPVTHKQYGGPLLLNPGGPGGSGVGFLLGAAPHIRDVIEADDEKYFDLMSFDPRGVGLSQPVVECIQDPFAELAFELRAREEGVYSASDAAFGRLWSMAVAHSGSCSLPTADGGPNIKSYVSTSSVARDMLEIVERHGEWREKEAERLLAAGTCNRNPRTGQMAQVKVPETLKHKKDEEKINYLGFSYGTYLGNTFAAMYPDRIHRLVVDGVVDAYDYKKTLWFDNLVDTEKAIGGLYYHCARVGYPRCSLANATAKTTEQGVKDRVGNIIDSLYHNPYPFISSYAPDVLSYSDIKGLLLGAAYSPIQAFPYVADLLAGIESGDLSGLSEPLNLRQTRAALPARGSQYSGSAFDANTGKHGLAVSQDATMAIACSDGDNQNEVSREEFAKYVGKLDEESPTVGELWSSLRLQCIHYKIRAYSRFEGPWHGNTSHPILEIGNTADPVTPGRFAKKMSAGFEGAGFLLQDSAGHCSLSSPSKCTESYLRKYFQSGELPEFGHVCPVDELPFGSDEEEVFDAETRRVRERAEGISNALYAAGGFGALRAPWFAQK